jgi:alpha-L-fucosidase 2
MLVQSKGQVVDLLPALPAAWPSGSLHGVRVRNAGVVDLDWRGGQLERVSLRYAAAGERTVVCGSVRRQVFVPAGGRVTLTGPSLRQA